MSGGRLVILPKKSYCPWKPENVERVLRDERLEKERLTQESTRSGRLEILRGAKKTLSQSPPHEHVNLFQQEEDESYRTGILQGKAQQQTRGVLPVVLGQSELEARGDNRPFYLRTAAEQKLLAPKDHQRKESLDPMKDFVQHRNETHIDTKLKRKSHLDASTDLPRKKKRGSEERRSTARHNDDETEKQRRHGSKRSKQRDSLETLRQRRLEREAIESKRAAAASMTRDDAGDWNDDRKRSYHNQYNPGRSRR
ncbi:hypothetical protein MHU86_4014 [Fragilaria crotonensis]|nr:hypothetical protein MHU86_4014 [Fragilaria crotonensis]